MPGPRRSFRHYAERAEAEEFVALLRSEGLDATVSENSAVFDVTFTAGAEQEYHVLLPADEFLRAEALLEQEARDIPLILPAEHYLRTFDNDELLDVLKEADAWSPEDRVRAERLLRDRGVQVDHEALRMARQHRMEELARPEKARWTWLAVGIALIWIGGIGGLVIGWSLMNARKVLPDGRSVYRYTEGDRRSGQIIFVMGAMVLVGMFYFLLRW
jgi:hypothetical protein